MFKNGQNLKKKYKSEFPNFQILNNIDFKMIFFNKLNIN